MTSLIDNKEYQKYLEDKGIIKKTHAVIDEIRLNLNRLGRDTNPDRPWLIFISPDSYGREETIFISVNGSPPQGRIILLGGPDRPHPNGSFSIDRYIVYGYNKIKTIKTNLHGGNEKKKIIEYGVLKQIPNMEILFHVEKTS